jgi:hypothetical protein
MNGNLFAVFDSFEMAESLNLEENCVLGFRESFLN